MWPSPTVDSSRPIGRRARRHGFDYVLEVNKSSRRTLRPSDGLEMLYLDETSSLYEIKP